MEKIIDTHSHIYLPEFASDLDDVVARAADAGVGKLLLPNIDSSTAADVLACCDRFPAYCLPMMGLHPTSVKENYREELAFVEKTLDENPGRFVAVGEVGLDLYWDTTFAEQQKEALERQIRMAIDRDLPLSIHCRDAFPELFDVLFKFRGQDKFRGVIHSFSGTHDDALRLLSLDTFMFGVNGTVTFRKSGLPAVLRSCVPAGRVLLETDCPYLAPVPYRGRRNESAYVVCVLRKLAEVYDLPEDVMARQTTENALALFGRI